jgi:perosamine synthetase
LTLHTLGIGPGDEVIIPDLTFAATAHAVLMVGATPVLVDADPVSWCADPRAIEKAISPRTRLLLPVHLYGHPCDMTAISDIARSHDLKVVEDAAQGLGATWNGQPLGSFGHAACFSFFGNKLITTGEGGMVVTSDDAFGARLRLLHAHGVDPKRRYFHAELAFNYRMTNLQAALGVAQLEQIHELVAMKRKIFGWYHERLAGRGGLVLNPRLDESSYWMTCVVLPPHLDRATVTARLSARGIESRPFFVPMSQLPHLAGFRRVSARGDDRCDVAAHLSVQGLNLPSGCATSEGDVDRVCSVLLDLACG